MNTAFYAFRHGYIHAHLPLNLPLLFQTSIIGQMIDQINAGEKVVRSENRKTDITGLDQENNEICIFFVVNWPIWLERIVVRHNMGYNTVGLHKIRAGELTG